MPVRSAHGLRSLLVGLVWCGVGFARVATARAEPTKQRVPVVFHVAQQAREAVVDAAFLRAQLSAANAVFGGLGIELICVDVRPAPRARPRLVSRVDRDQLGALLLPNVINVFVVASLMDVDEPGRERRGVHWRVRSDRRRHLLIVSAISGPYVFAHELGHYLGNQAHSDTPGNLMSYLPGEGVPVLEEAQGEKVRVTLAQLFESGELRAAAGPARCP